MEQVLILTPRIESDQLQTVILAFVVIHANQKIVKRVTRLKITDSRSPVMMTAQIFFSPDKPWFWPVKLMNIIIFFLPMEYRITPAVDHCTALSFGFLPASWWKIHSHVAEFLSVIFSHFMSVYIYLQYHRTVVSEVSTVCPFSAYRWNLILFVARHVIESLLHKEEFRH